MILESNQWKEALRNNFVDSNGVLQTPMRLLIKDFPDLVKLRFFFNSLWSWLIFIIWLMLSIKIFFSQLNTADIFSRPDKFSTAANTPTFRLKLFVERKRKKENSINPSRRTPSHTTTPTSRSPSTSSSLTTHTSRRKRPATIPARPSTAGRGRCQRPWSLWPNRRWPSTPAASGTRTITCSPTRCPTQSPAPFSRWTTPWWSWCKMAERWV